MGDVEMAYIAGYFDGEGSVTGRMPTKTSSAIAVVTFSQRDRSPLERIQGVLDMGTLHVARETGTWCLQIARRDDVLRFVRAVYPYVRQKRAQLRLAYRLALLTGKAGTAVSPVDRLRRRELAAEIQALNLIGKLKPVANRNARRAS